MFNTVKNNQLFGDYSHCATCNSFKYIFFSNFMISFHCFISIYIHVYKDLAIFLFVCKLSSFLNTLIRFYVYLKIVLLYLWILFYYKHHSCYNLQWHFIFLFFCQVKKKVSVCTNVKRKQWHIYFTYIFSGLLGDIKRGYLK